MRTSIRDGIPRINKLEQSLVTTDFIQTITCMSIGFGTQSKVAETSA